MYPDESLSEPADEQPIYMAPQTYRRPMFLVVGCALFVSGSALLAWFIFSGPRTLEHHLTSEGLNPKLISFTMAMLGCHFLWLYFVVKARSLHIGHRGIVNGRRFYAWEEIQSLHGRVEMTPIRLVLRTKGWLPVNVYLHTDDGLTDAEYEALMRELQKEAAPRLPHLSFWPE